MKWNDRLKAMISAATDAETTFIPEYGTDKRCQNHLLSAFVSSQYGQISKLENESAAEIIISTVQGYLWDGINPISRNDAVEAYSAKLELVRADPHLTAVFNDICEERKSILMECGRMTEEAAEAYVSDIQFLTTALMMT